MQREIFAIFYGFSEMNAKLRICKQIQQTGIYVWLFILYEFRKCNFVVVKSPVNRCMNNWTKKRYSLLLRKV